MINAVYRLIAPRMIDVTYREVAIAGKTLVRPAFLSICRADQRYYQGQRPAQTMQEKLPMALLHECVGQVVYDATGTFQSGDWVVPIPNTPHEYDAVAAENYLRSSDFASSGTDGFLRDYIDYPPQRLVALPGGINLHVASFVELISVAIHAIARFSSFSHKRKDVIGVWGDGNLGFITALLLKQRYPNAKLHVFGLVEAKLAYFTFADGVYHTNRMPADLQIDHAFECVGGAGAQSAIQQVIDHIRPEGTITLMGVSEEPVPVSTRMVLEKGLRIIGASRSGRQDFLDTVVLLQKQPLLVSYLENLIGEVLPVRTISDIHAAFEADIRRGFGKTILQWQK